MADFAASPGSPRGAAPMATLHLTRPVFDFSLTAMVRKIGRIVDSIAAGQRAADDFRRLNARTDAQLAADSISRADIARIVFERHFD
ncbi:MAG: hypothetical protein ACE5EU_08550 [Paracoccaceae bacterium]